MVAVAGSRSTSHRPLHVRSMTGSGCHACQVCIFPDAGCSRHLRSSTADAKGDRAVARQSCTRSKQPRNKRSGGDNPWQGRGYLPPPGTTSCVERCSWQESDQFHLAAGAASWTRAAAGRLCSLHRILVRLECMIFWIVHPGAVSPVRVTWSPVAHKSSFVVCNFAGADP